jgi:subtilisin family serine protease
VFEVPEGMTVNEALAALESDPRIELAQRMNSFETLAARYDDPYADLQPSLQQLDVESAHAIATGRDVLVAVIDSAVDAVHADLRDRMRVARDVVRGGRAPRNGEVHGTAVAGVIASTVDNAEGIIGIAPEVDIAALRACWSPDRDALRAECSSFTLAQALELALELEPHIINLSLAGPPDPLLSQLLEEALSRGIVVVAAEPETQALAGGWPTSNPRVIAARSTHPRDATPRRWLLAAPADEILTTAPGSEYAFLSGNSLAAAHVTGAIALLIERDSSLDAQRIAALLLDTTSRADGFESINACKALERLALRAACGLPVAVSAVARRSATAATYSVP